MRELGRTSLFALLIIGILTTGCDDNEYCDRMLKSLTDLLVKTHQNVTHWTCVHAQHGSGCLVSIETASGTAGTTSTTGTTGTTGTTATTGTGGTGGGTATGGASMVNKGHVTISEGLAVDFTAIPCPQTAAAAIAPVGSGTAPVSSASMPKSLKVGFEMGNSGSTASLHASVGDVMVPFSVDDVSAKALADRQGGSWRVFSTDRLDLIPTSQDPNSSVHFSVAYSVVRVRDLTPAGTPLPAVNTLKVAGKLGDDQWIVGREQTPIDYDDVIVSFSAPRDSEVELKKNVPVREPSTIGQGHPLVIDSVFLKSSTGKAQTITLQAQVLDSSGSRSVRSIPVTTIELRPYDLRSFTAIRIPTQDLPLGGGVVRVAALNTKKEIVGSKSVSFHLVPLE